MSRMDEAWPRFLAAFAAAAPEVTSCEAVVKLPERIARVAGWVGQQLTATPTTPFATLLHGDYKAANLFLPPSLSGGGGSVSVDFQWVGLGCGMSDVAYHLSHAVGVDALEADDGEAGLVDWYIAALRGRLPAAAAAAYTDDIARRQYSLAVVDYARLVFTRFVADASPASFAAALARRVFPVPGGPYRMAP